MSDYLKYFFSPSPELAREIVLANELLAAEDEERSAGAKLDAEDNEEGITIDKASRLLYGESNFSHNELDEQLESPERVVADRLYGYLALLARSPQAEEGRPYDMDEVIPEGMETMLGLEDSADRYKDLLLDLTSVFRCWMMDKSGHYSTPWGDIDLEGNQLRLTAKIVHRKESRRPYSPATFIDPPSPAYRKREGR